MAVMQNGVVDMQSTAQMCVGTCLEIQIDDLPHRLTDAKSDVGRCADRRKIDVQRLGRFVGLNARKDGEIGGMPGDDVLELASNRCAIVASIAFSE